MSSTHEVVNQAPPRQDVNEFLTNTALVEAVGHSDAAWAGADLASVGSLVGRADFQHDAELANVHSPVLHSHDRWGRRVDDIEFHPAYHRIIGEAIGHGAHTTS